MGQGLRAVGRSLKVTMVQFLKTRDSGELHSTERFGDFFRIMRFESEKGFLFSLKPEQKVLLKSEIKTAMEYVKAVTEEHGCDVLILDEIAAVLQNGLFDTSEFIEILKKKPDTMEIILTGRDMPKEILNAADLVTEMREEKHYFSKGIMARNGIEE